MAQFLDKVGQIGKFCVRGNRPKWAFAILIVGIIAGGFNGTRLKVGDTRLGASIFYPDHPYNTGYKHINENFWGTNELVIIMAGKEADALKDPFVLQKMEELRHHMSQDENLGGTMAFLDLIRGINRMFHESIPQWEVVPSDMKLLAQELFLLQINTSPGEMTRFFSPEYKNSTIMFYYKDYSNTIINTAIGRAKEFIAANPLGDKGEWRLAGGLMGVMAAVNTETAWSYWANMITIFLAVIIMCIILYKSWKVAVVLVLPLYLSQVICEALMLFYGIDLNINSLPVASIGVGLGIDYGIYMLSRIQVEYYKLGDYHAAIHKTLSTTGRAVIFTALTMMAGVIFWFLSGIKFHTQMANLIAVLLVLNMLGAMILVPSLVLLLKPWKGASDPKAMLMAH